MKYNVEFKCGHTEEVELFGKFKDREREIERLKECNCSACRKLAFRKEMSAEYDEVRMSYSEYKKSYSNCKTLHDSYDTVTKTIIVFVKKKADKLQSDTVKDKVIEKAEKFVTDEKESIKRNAHVMTSALEKLVKKYDSDAAIAELDDALTKLKSVNDDMFFELAYYGDIKEVLNQFK